MKQTVFMVLATLVGTLGALAVEPAIGVAVYYFFAVLRPQYIWLWALPANIGWSGFVAYATMASTLIYSMGRSAPAGPRLIFAHKAFAVFGVWLVLTYVMALNQTVAWPWLQEYLKIFMMFGVAALALTRIAHLWWVYLSASVALIYVAYEMNFLYFSAGRLDIYHNGYGGLDNNGAALMLAMGIPLAVNAWEAIPTRSRWLFLGGVPLILHAVLMSYSRGAMVSLIIVTPLLVLRSRRKKLFGLAIAGLLAMVPFLAGQQIRDRFFSVQKYEVDDSANSRFQSWNAAFRIANDYPIFGAGIRNSNLLSYRYGADMEGRTIHSQYLQTMADSGYVGLGLYLLAMSATWVSIVRTRRTLLQSGTSGDKADDEENQRAISMLNGVEGALVVFMFGAIFLSLEVFELPYLLSLVGVQMALLVRQKAAAKAKASPQAAPTPVRMRWRPEPPSWRDSRQPSLRNSRH